jgi:hypothetical protein
MRRAEALRDKIMRGVGTDEAWVIEQGVVSMHYRKPLRIDEIARMRQSITLTASQLTERRHRSAWRVRLTAARRNRRGDQGEA